MTDNGDWKAPDGTRQPSWQEWTDPDRSRPKVSRSCGLHVCRGQGSALPRSPAEARWCIPAAEPAEPVRTNLEVCILSAAGAGGLPAIDTPGVASGHSGPLPASNSHHLPRRRRPSTPSTPSRRAWRAAHAVVAMPPPRRTGCSYLLRPDYAVRTSSVRSMDALHCTRSSPPSGFPTLPPIWNEGPHGAAAITPHGGF